MEQVLCTRRINLTFNSAILPSRIKLVQLSCTVRSYIPNTQPCFQCQRYDPVKTFCHGFVTWIRCEEVFQNSIAYENPELCASCHGNYATYSRSCSNWIDEKDILAAKITQNLSYPEANHKNLMLLKLLDVTNTTRKINITCTE